MSEFSELLARARARGNAELGRVVARYPVGTAVWVTNETGTGVIATVIGHELNNIYKPLIVTDNAGVAYTYELEVIL